MWTGLYPGKPEDEVPIGHITNGVHVPSWLAPQMFRLYDRHLGTAGMSTAASRASGKASKRRRRRTLGNAPQPEIAAARIRAPRAVEQAERAGESPRKSAAPRAASSVPDALTIGFARRFATYKRANLILADIESWLDGERSQAPGAVRFRRQGASARRTRQARAAADRQLMRDPKIRRQVRLRRGLRHQRRPPFRAGRGRVAEQSAPAAGSLRHQRPEGGLNGGLNLSVLDGWWAEAYDGLNGFAIGTGGRTPTWTCTTRAMAKTCTACCAKK
jgi:starch phosphorylase